MMDIDVELQKRHTISIQGEMTKKTLNEATRQLAELEMTPECERIDLLISSGGGDTRAGFGIADFIRHMVSKPVRGIAFDTCGSSAVVVMLACKERLALPYTRFLVHSCTQAVERINPFSLEYKKNLEEIQEELSRVHDRWLNYHVEHLTPSDWDTTTSRREKEEFVLREFIRGDSRFEGLLTAEEALEVGIISRIVASDEKLDTLSLK